MGKKGQGNIGIENGYGISVGVEEMSLVETGQRKGVR